MRAYIVPALLAALALAPACTKPLAYAKVVEPQATVSRDYAATANDAYYAIRWALDAEGLPIATENLAEGLLTTTWMPVTSDSHYISVFGRRDYGVTNSYHQLVIKVVPEGGRTRVDIGSRVQTLVSRLESSGIEEGKVLDKVGDCLRKAEPSLSNLGIDE